MKGDRALDEDAPPHTHTHTMEDALIGLSEQLMRCQKVVLLLVSKESQLCREKCFE